MARRPTIDDEIDDDDLDSHDDDDGAEAAAADSEIPDDEDEDESPRVARRRARLKTIAESKLKDELTATQSRLAYLEGLASAYPDPATLARGPQEAPKDPDQAEVDQCNQEIESIGKRARRGNLTEEEASDLQHRLTAMETRRQQALIRQTMRQAAPQQHPQAVAAQAIRMLQASKNPDIWNDQRALTVARAAYEELKAQGMPEGEATANRAYELTRERLKMKPQQAPQASRADQRSMMTGVSRGAVGPRAASDGIEWTEDLAAMANAAYRHKTKDPKQQKKMWLKGPGKAFLKGQS